MKTTSILFLLTIATISFSQRANIWYFGDNAGLDFNSGSPVLLTDGALSTHEGCASICDSSGNLLFYTDGDKVWNRNHNMMPNGDNLKGTYSTSQSAIIVQKPRSTPDSSTTEYYIFNASQEVDHDGVYYSIVDMTMDGGNGDVSVKNQVLIPESTDYSTERITAARHCNGTDYWIIAHGWENDSFYVWQLTPDSILLPPVISDVGTVHTGSARTESIGYLKASHDDKKIACSIAGSLDMIEVFDFDNATGVLSNPIQIPVANGAYGIEFSPNNNLLYSGAWSGDIHQYDLAAGNEADIIASRVTLATGESCGAIQLGPDNKIYIAAWEPYLHVIDNPNIPGTGCNLQLAGLSLSPKESRYGLPDYHPLNEYTIVTDTSAESPFCRDGCDGSASVETGSCKAPYSFSWSNGGNTQTITNLCPGTYTVTVTDGDAVTNTADVIVTNPPSTIIIDSSFIEYLPGDTSINVYAHHISDSSGATTSGLLGEFTFDADLSPDSVMSGIDITDILASNLSPNQFSGRMRVYPDASGSYDATEYFGFTVYETSTCGIQFNSSDALSFEASRGFGPTPDLKVEYRVDGGSFTLLDEEIDFDRSQTLYTWNFPDTVTVEDSINFRYYFRDLETEYVYIYDIELTGAIVCEPQSLVYDIGTGSQDSGIFHGLDTGGVYYVTITDEDGCEEIAGPFTITTVPIELISFKGWNKGSINELEWSTASESNSDYFLVEKSLDGASFTAFAQIPAAGNSHTTKQYHAIDQNPAKGINYYRLKQVDFNRTFKYSPVISVINGAAGFYIRNIYPNPAEDEITVSTTSNTEGAMQILLYDYTGRELKRITDRIKPGDSSFDIDVSTLSAGWYMLRIMSPDGKLQAVNEFRIK